MNERIAVIGSNSFSGATFVRHALTAGCEVLGISRSEQPHPAFLPYRWNEGEGLDRFAFMRGDLNADTHVIMDALHEHKPLYVFNFAAQSMVAQSWEHPEHWYRTNVLAQVRLHDGLRKLPSMKKYVHISTPEVYGHCEGVIQENMSYHPSTPYATSRAACDMHLMNYFANYAFPVVFTRAANVYGPGQQLYRIIPRTIMYARLGKKLQLHGGGESVRSFVYMDDVARGTLAAAREAEPSLIFHFSTDEFISIRDLVRLICEKLGVAFDTLVEASPERPGKDAAYKLDAGKARRELKWQPVMGLAEGVESTVKWAEQYFDELVDQPMAYLHKA